MESDIEIRLRGALWRHIVQEFFINTAHFPIALVLLEFLRESPLTYVTKPDFYAIVSAALVQAAFLASWEYAGRPRALVGNLIGPAFYTTIEVAFEGLGFFSEPPHLAYWVFALVIGLAQEMRHRFPGKLGNALILLENFVRTSILLVMYGIFEGLTHPEIRSVAIFLEDDSHVFIALALLFIGLAVGLANLAAHTYLSMLRRTAAQLRVYSEWLLGRALLARAVTDPQTLTLRRRARAILFMDIRDFTRWSEAHAPEQVVALINIYFETAERVWSKFKTIKIKLSADEVMIVFPEVESAARAAIELSCAISRVLSAQQLDAGIGLHAGPLVEGLVGSTQVKGYDVIGDTVNTARRICSAARGGEILLSSSVFDALGQGVGVLPARQISAKGKEEPLWVFPLQAIT